MAKPTSHWSDLDPDTAMLEALDAADAGGTRASIVTSGDNHQKRNWSNRFADACAIMVADAVRRHSFADNLTVLPDPTGTAEPPTIVVWEKGEKTHKKIDVVVGDLVAGLQVAISLKGGGFRDLAGRQYDKNLTGRMYELENETRQLHTYRPQAVVVALYFFPLASVCDKKTDRSPSSFAHAVSALRKVTGRADPRNQDEWHYLDLAFVALYVPGDPERWDDPKTGEALTYDDPFPRGIVRYFDVTDDPPKRGRPACKTTLSLDQVVDRIASRFTGDADGGEINWSVCEPDAPYGRANGTSPPESE